MQAPKVTPMFTQTDLDSSRAVPSRLRLGFRFIVAALTLSASCVLPLALVVGTAIPAYAQTTAPAWAAGTSYQVGDVVSYQGINYVCIQAHTALTGWEPPNVPALWSVSTSTPPPTIPAVPTGLTATANSSSQITVTWNSSSGATSYDLKVDGTIKTNVTSPYVQTGLAASSTHTYAVRADNSAGNSAFSASVSAMTLGSVPTVPTTPTGLTATVNSSSQITVTWNGSSGATSYDLQVDGAIKTNVTSPYVQTGLAASSTHTYAVRADNSAGDSAFSALVSATTQSSGSTGGTKATGVPGTPDLSQSSWNGESSYTITMNMWWGNNGTTWQLYENGALVHTQTLTDNSPNAQTASFSFTGKTNGTYTYTNKLTNSFGTTSGNTLVYTVTQGGSVPTVPSTPTGLAATANSTSQITVTWNGSSGATSYDLQVDGVTKTNVTSPYVQTGLAASSTHTYAVRADNSVGDSAFSASVSATTQAVPTVPSTPTGLAATPNGANQITVTWNASSGATSYDLQVDGALKTNVTSPYVQTGLAANSKHTYAVRADNSAGDSAFSAAVSATTGSSGSPSPLPKHLLAGYWQDFNNGAKVLRISDVPTTYNLIIVAFANATGTPGAVSFDIDSGLSSALGGYSQAQFIADIATVKARGQHVILSVGGQNGAISVSDSASASNFANSVNALMSQYGFEGVDIDLENGINSTYMAQALRAIKSGSIITMAPQTLDMQTTGMQYFQLALAIKDILTICNTQYYNSGSMLGYDGKVYSEGNVDFLTALATIQLQNGLRPDQVGLGLPASPSGAGSGYVSPSVVNQALAILATGASGGTFRPPQTYPSLRGAMTWSINWDASNGYNFANTVSSELKALP